ncbi:hypothetical protein [Agrobacterium sp. MS2]|uniref:hypothetical protein n=1 Tax=Agrobacterium sp. MS2 TaxID=1345498 RepID=UPI0011B94A3E|nr:hypothetical protein [Agrobacterium sp. MS2]
MVMAVKKQTIRDLKYFETQFATVQLAASEYERHERTNRQKQFFALEKVFEFGREIAGQPDVFEAFLNARKLPLNKTTRDNPYNALVQLAFEKPPSKSWHSQCSNVLHYAMYEAGNTPLSEWLNIDGGVTERYKESVSYFSRTASTKAKRLKSARLEIAKQRYSTVAGKSALPGVATMAEGFYRSLVYSDGTNSYVVDIREGDQDAVVEKYLLDLVSGQQPSSHPLAEKTLFRFFRAIDLICGLCGKGRSNEQRFIGLWNETIAGVETTKVTILSDAYIFTNATFTLAEPVAALTGKGTLLLSWADAEGFRADFSKNGDWQFHVRDNGVWLENDAKPKTALQLHPFATFNDAKLRMGVKPTRQSNHFMAPIAKMDAALKKNNAASTEFKKKNARQDTSLPTPNKFKWVVNRNDALLEIDQPQTFIDPSYDFMDFAAPATPLVPDRHISIADMRRLWTVLPAFGEDKRGYIGDSDVADAAFCIDDTFEGDDHILYVSPMIIGSNKKDRTQVCEDFAAAPVPLPVSVAPSSGPAPVWPTSATSNGGTTTKTAGRSQTSAKSETALSADPEDLCPPIYSKKLQGNWHNKRLRGVAWPAVTYKSRKVFGAYITSFMPENAEKRICRHYDLEWQLRWWRRMTDIPVTIIASGWTDEEISSHGELHRVAENGGRIIRTAGRELIDNRRHSLQEFYDSNHDWGIIMDDDASLHHSDGHNSGASFFSEMAANDPAAYEAIDVFSPFTGKMPSHNVVWREIPQLFKGNHVFDPYYDLKGSMYVVRNFRKLGRPEILPPASFRLHGEDTLFGIEAISKGASIYRCDNIVLRELRSGGSAFPDRETNMKIGNIEIARMYAHEELKMGSTHLLDRSDMLRLKGRSDDQRIIIAKP